MYYENIIYRVERVQLDFPIKYKHCNRAFITYEVVFYVASTFETLYQLCWSFTSRETNYCAKFKVDGCRMPFNWSGKYSLITKLSNQKLFASLNRQNYKVYLVTKFLLRLGNI